MTSSLSTAQKRAELERGKALLEEQAKALKERSFITEFWETMGKRTGTTQADELARTQAFVRDQEALLKKQESQETAAMTDKMKRDAKLQEIKGSTDFLGANSVEDAGEKLNKLQGLASKLKGKDFNVGDVLNEVRDKLKNIDFNIFDEKQSKQLEDFSIQVSSLGLLGSTIRNITQAQKDVSDSIKSAGASITSDRSCQQHGEAG